MKLYRSVCAAFLVLLLLFSLTGCALFKGSGSDLSDKEQLIQILNDISASFHPGTAGSSLNAIRMAAKLITWASTTNMDKKEAAAVVADWLKEQSPEIRQAFEQKLSGIKDAFGRIVVDGASDLLESAGVEKDFSNLGSRLKEIVSAILASGGLN